MERPRAARVWHTRKIRLGEDDGLIDGAMESLDGDERMTSVDALYADAARWNGQDLSQFRLCRSAARIERRRR